MKIIKQEVQAIADLKAGYTLGHADVAILNELARIALASLEAEAIAVRARWKDEGCGHGDWRYYNIAHKDALMADETSECELIYTAPPAQVAVPDEMTPKQASRSYCGEVRGYRDGWNACRAAILQGAEPESHAYALPANSFSNKELEGMAHGDNPQANAYRELLAFRLNSPVTPDGWQLVPKEPTEAMNKAGWAAINEHDEINPTYRAMLVAAPQHEVNK